MQGCRRRCSLQIGVLRGSKRPEPLQELLGRRVAQTGEEPAAAEHHLHRLYKIYKRASFFSQSASLIISAAFCQMTSCFHLLISRCVVNAAAV